MEASGVLPPPTPDSGVDVDTPLLCAALVSCKPYDITSLSGACSTPADWLSHIQDMLKELKRLARRPDTLAALKPLTALRSTSARKLWGQLVNAWQPVGWLDESAVFLNACEYIRYK